MQFHLGQHQWNNPSATQPPFASRPPNLKPIYFLPDDPFIEEALIPNFAVATAVDSMMGFFTSNVLASLAPGLATFINRSTGTFRLVISPMLQQDDIEAIRLGTMTTEQVALNFLDNLIVTEDLIQLHTLRCFSWLLAKQRIDIRIALMRDALFHPKVWLFHSGNGETVAAHGSSNLTYAGLQKNIEQIAIATSWGSSEQEYTTHKLQDHFESLWSNNNDNCIVVNLPSAIQHRLFSPHAQSEPPQESDLRELYDRARSQRVLTAPEVVLPRTRFQVPPELQYQSGPYAHQGKAVKAWCHSGYHGILEMATGSGKTITAMICARNCYENHKPLLIVIAAPYLPLIQQWCEEVKPFGIVPLDLTEHSGPSGRATALGRLRRRLANHSPDVAVVVLTHRALCDSQVQKELARFQCTKLLIADEVHNLGAAGFTTTPPDFFDYRLGLSATPVRQYDQEGTEALAAFFGPIVFQYTLEEAIGNCLVEYDYYVHPVELTEDEMDKWYDITEAIRRNTWRMQNDTSDDFVTKLLRDRRTILENASNKIAVLSSLLDEEGVQNLKYVLIYASDKAPGQLENVNALLNLKGILFHQLTAAETANHSATRRLLRTFQSGTLDILTAKRVLDEGVNIPQIHKGYILASTTVERQWIQRRGRLLRKSPETGKTHSVIHDFVPLPPFAQSDTDTRSIARSELLRVKEFARLARNAGRPNGPLNTIDKLIAAAYL